MQPDPAQTPDRSPDQETQYPIDPLQPPDDLFNPVRDQEQLPQDNQTPLAGPDDVPQSMPADHPVTDSDVDSQEVYDAGLNSVADMPGGVNRQDNDATDQLTAPLEPDDEA